VATPQLADALGLARDEGVTRLAEIADGASRPLGVDRTELHSYLRDSLRFTLGPRERQGMRRFFALAEQHTLITQFAVG
jgi:predicted solute-binding protein